MKERKRERDERKKERRQERKHIVVMVKLLFVL